MIFWSMVRRKRENSLWIRELHFLWSPEEQETIQKSRDPSVITTASGTTPTTKGATRKCMWFGHVVSGSTIERITRGGLARWIARRKVLSYEWRHLGQPSNLVKNGANSFVKNRQPHSFGGSRRASNRAPDQRSGWPEAGTSCGRHERRVETELPEWLQPFTEGLTGRIFKFGRRLSSLRGHTTSSNSFIPASSSKTFFKQIRTKAQFVHSLKKKPSCVACRRTKVTKAPCKINPDDRADRIKIVERLGDILTADHKVLNEDQESTLHHKCAVVVQDLANQWLQSYPCTTKSAQETMRSLREILGSRRKSEIHLFGQFSKIHQSSRRAQVEPWKIYSAQIRNKGIAERAARRIKEGTSSTLVQSGLESWWAEHWALLLSPKCVWPDIPWTSGQFTIWRACDSIWSRSDMLHNITRGPRSSASVRHKSPSWNTHWIRLERGEKLDWWSFDCWFGRSENNSITWNSCKKIQFNKSSQQKNEFVSPCKAGDMLQERQPLSAAVYQAGCDLLRESQQHSTEEKEETRDPDPDVETRQDLCNIMRNYKNIGIMVFRQRNSVPNDDFRCLGITLISRDKRKFALTYFMKQPSMIIGTFVETLHWKDSNCSTQNSPERPIAGAKLRDKETSYHKTFKILAGRMVKNVEKRSAQSWQEMDPAREQRGIYFTPNDEPVHEESMNNAKNLGDIKNLSDALKSHHTNQTERFKLAVTLCKCLV